jgi:hypothetical protein
MFGGDSIRSTSEYKCGKAGVYLPLAVMSPPYQVLLHQKIFVNMTDRALGVDVSFRKSLEILGRLVNVVHVLGGA